MIEVEGLLQVKSNKGLSNVGDPGGLRARGVLRSSKRVNGLSGIRVGDARGCRCSENAVLLGVVYHSFTVVINPHCGSRKEN